MFDIKSIPDYSEFKYWFKRVRNSDGRDAIAVSSVETGDFIRFLELQEESEDASLAEDVDIVADYKKFMLCPEYYVGLPVDLEGSQEYKIATYERILVGSRLLNEPISRKNKVAEIYGSRMLEWLRSTDMYVAPGSTVFHDSYEGGLLDHSLRVYNLANELMRAPKFTLANLGSVAMAALVHDWCKIGLYAKYRKNVKNEDTGKWEQQDAFKYDQKGAPLGHGVTSMFLAGKFFNLSVEEAAAIRWHMGAYRTVEAEFSEMQMANETYPLVHLIQFADQLSLAKF